MKNMTDAKHTDMPFTLIGPASLATVVGGGCPSGKKLSFQPLFLGPGSKCK